MTSPIIIQGISINTVVSFEGNIHTEGGSVGGCEGAFSLLTKESLPFAVEIHTWVVDRLRYHLFWQRRASSLCFIRGYRRVPYLGKAAVVVDPSEVDSSYRLRRLLELRFDAVIFIFSWRLGKNAKHRFEVFLQSSEKVELKVGY